MKIRMKNITLALLAGSAICLCGGLATAQKVALAADDGVYAFLNVGADTNAAKADAAIGLSQTDNAEVTEGTVTSGSTLFTSYSENATCTVTLSEGSYRASIAVLAEQGTQVKVGEQAVALPENASGETVVTAAVSGTFTVQVTGKLCGVLVTDPDAEQLFTVHYNEAQVIPYGAEVAPLLEKAQGFYADGTTKELEVEYGDIMAVGGVNVNFTTVEVTGKVEGTQLEITRYLTTMPEDLVYFINCGSYDELDETFPEEETRDGYYRLNQTIFDYYGQQLLNYGTPDQKSAGDNDWGIYTKFAHNAPGDATFPYNSMVWTGDTVGASDMGYRLTGLSAGQSYRIWIGTLSHWHSRTSNITFNGAAVPGQETIRIAASKGYTVFENIAADASGKVDIHLTQIGSQNEPTLCFIAVQREETAIPALPEDVQGPVTVGMEDHTYTFTGATAGAKIQLYNAVKPNQILFEETVDEQKITEGSYTVDYVQPFEGISQFYAVQLTGGGASVPHLVSVTDIEGFRITLTPDGYTTGAVTVTVEAQASSGIASWAYRLGEYGAESTFPLERPFSIKESFEAAENGDYYIVVTSGLGVTYSEKVTVSTIDAAAPAIVLTPSKEGWAKGAYHVQLSVQCVAPVAQYQLFKAGKQVASAESAPDSITFTEEGEYVVFVRTAAGQSAASTLYVSERPSTTRVAKSYANRTLTYTFGDTPDYIVSAVAAYQLREDGVSRMTIASGNRMDVYDEGTYVVTVTTANGEVEMFALNVEKKDFSADSDEGCKGALGTGAGMSAVILCAFACGLTLLSGRKKRERN